MKAFKSDQQNEKNLHSEISNQITVIKNKCLFGCLSTLEQKHLKIQLALNKHTSQMHSHNMCNKNNMVYWM